MSVVEHGIPKSSHSPPTARGPRAASPSDRWRARVFEQLRLVQAGQITVVDGDEQFRFGESTAAGHLQAEITVYDPRFYSEVALGGNLAAGEAFVRGWWTCDDLTALVRIFLQNLDASWALDEGASAVKQLVRRAWQWWHRNTRAGSRENIAAHYDLGNELFQLMLDETMMYSCAIFDTAETSLRDASTAKLDRVCRRLELAPRDHLLEIGTGWGGLAIHAARNFGCRVTTITISQEQFLFARQRIAAAGLSDRVTVCRQDYRDVTGQFDKLVSIEMLEAVGHRYFDQFFATCGRVLRPAGQMLLQTITIPDQRFAGYTKSVDFIQRYIFPGGCLPSVTAICDSLTCASDLRLAHLESIGPHYARTLRAWRQRFWQAIEQVKRLGYTDSFIRMWDFYLCYCEAGFLERSIDDVQMLLVKPGWGRSAE